MTASDQGASSFSPGPERFSARGFLFFPMNTSAPVLRPDIPAAPEGDAPGRWRLLILAAGEPLLLSRILQKLTVPEIELRAARYDCGPPDADARVELTLLTRPARARLAAVRLQKIVGVQAVDLREADSP